MFPSARGEYIYYFDSDILHKPGWFQKTMEIFDAFPKAGVVSSFPFISPDRFKTTLKIAQKNSDIEVEKGISCIDKSDLSIMAKSLGKDPSEYIKSRVKAGIYKVRKNNIDAVIASSHCQFLIKASIIHNIFPRNADWALNNNPEREFDRLIEVQQVMRLGTTDSYIYHMGNSIDSDIFDSINLYSINSLADGVKLNKHSPMPNWVRVILLNKMIKSITMRLYGVLFRIVYGVY